MGCHSSTLKILADSPGPSYGLRASPGCDADATKGYIQIMNEISPRVRLEHSEAMRELSICGDVFNFKINYCYISQRGYYPNALSKANQDCYLICESLLGDPNSHLFAIFDGHGEYGDSCSHFAANSVKVLIKNGGVSALDGPDMESIYSQAIVNANKAMHQSKIDDSLSGTTCISVIVRGDTLLIANVGDSRAIIASEMDDGLIYSPLSADQTPFRKDERERVKMMGARVLTLEQIEGKEPIHENWGAETGDGIDETGDPPRVWDSTLERPGCAFTRSLGDSIAEACGVCAEPEILAWKLSSCNKYVIIASDGVFEFLTSQAVIDIISKFENVLEGAKYVVAEAYRLWLTYDERTDDISMIVLRIEDMTETVGVKQDEVMTRHQSCIIETGSNKASRESKPVRRGMSHAKRKLVSAYLDREESEHLDLESLVTFKVLYVRLDTQFWQCYLLSISSI
jgi:serine/threonine protein phosphatase PrpC